jgi:hypothetical protein
MTAAYRFNPAFQSPQGSPIRELFKYTQQPGMISFAGGYPALRCSIRKAGKSAATLLERRSGSLPAIWRDRRHGGAGPGLA